MSQLATRVNGQTGNCRRPSLSAEASGIVECRQGAVLRSVHSPKSINTINGCVLGLSFRMICYAAIVTGTIIHKNMINSHKLKKIKTSTEMGTRWWVHCWEVQNHEKWPIEVEVREWLLFRVYWLGGNTKKDSQSIHDFLYLRLGVQFMSMITCKNSSSLTQQIQNHFFKNKFT